MFNYLKSELIKNWHLLVLGTQQDVDRVLDWITDNHEGKVLMTIADDIAAIKAAVTNPAPVKVDLSTVATAEALAAVATDVTTIKADLTLTPPTA